MRYSEAFRYYFKTSVYNLTAVLYLTREGRAGIGMYATHYVKNDSKEVFVRVADLIPVMTVVREAREHSAYIKAMVLDGFTTA